MSPATPPSACWLGKITNPVKPRTEPHVLSRTCHQHEQLRKRSVRSRSIKVLLRYHKWTRPLSWIRDAEFINRLTYFFSFLKLLQVGSGGLYVSPLTDRVTLLLLQCLFQWAVIFVWRVDEEAGTAIFLFRNRPGRRERPCPRSQAHKSDNTHQ